MNNTAVKSHPKASTEALWGSKRHYIWLSKISWRKISSQQSQSKSTTDGKLMNVSIDLFFHPEVTAAHQRCVCVCACKLTLMYMFLKCAVISCTCLLCRNWVSTNPIPPFRREQNIPAATAIRAVNNPSRLLRQGPFSSLRRWCQRTVRCLQPKHGCHFPHPTLT